MVVFGSLVCAGYPLATADAVYTPVFNTSDARRVVTGTSRSTSLLDGYRDELPVRTERNVDGEAAYSDDS